MSLNIKHRNGVAVLWTLFSVYVFVHFRIYCRTNTDEKLRMLLNMLGIKILTKQHLLQISNTNNS